jgi:hypothetical protein
MPSHSEWDRSLIFRNFSSQSENLITSVIKLKVDQGSNGRRMGFSAYIEGLKNRFSVWRPLTQSLTSSRILRSGVGATPTLLDAITSDWQVIATPIRCYVVVDWMIGFRMTQKYLTTLENMIKNRRRIPDIRTIIPSWESNVVTISNDESTHMG